VCPYDRLELFGASTAGALHFPQGVAFGPGRTIYATDPQQAGQWPGVLVFDASGRYVQTLRVPDSYDSYGPQPALLAVSPDGHVYAVEYGGGRLWRWDANGNFVGMTPLARRTGAERGCPCDRDCRGG
jgi:DNA-binding beta-propeller fold protein YncE